MDASLATVWGFGLVLLRTAGLCMTAPLIGVRVVPARVRLGLAFSLAMAIHAGAGSPAVPVPAGVAGLGLAVAVESMTGLLGGLAARWVLEAALTAGHVAGLSAGLGFSALVDPISGAESNGLSQLLSAGAQLAALSMGVHREAVAWLARAVVSWPPGTTPPLGALAAQVVAHGLLAMVLAVRLAFPVMAAVMLGHATMGVVSKMAPQLSLSNVGFSIALLCGGLGIYLSAPAIAEIVARAAVTAFQG